MYKRHVLLDIDGKDWMEMQGKYGYDPTREEQAVKPPRGNDALRAIVVLGGIGEGWRDGG